MFHKGTIKRAVVIINGEKQTGRREEDHAESIKSVDIEV